MNNTSASNVVSVSEFGKDHGLLHELVVTGRKVGAGQGFYSRLAHNENLFRRIVKEVMQMVVATQPFDPVSFIGKNWSLVPEEHDSRCDSLVEVDFLSERVSFETCLKEDESFIKGEEKLVRLKASGKIRLGATVFAGLWVDYQEHKAGSVLELLYNEHGITYLDFFGDVLLDQLFSRRCVLCLYRGDDGAWHWYYFWLVDGRGADLRSASLASQESVLENKSS